jgi:hypothetical protein
MRKWGCRQSNTERWSGGSGGGQAQDGHGHGGSAASSARETMESGEGKQKAEIERMGGVGCSVPALEGAGRGSARGSNGGVRTRAWSPRRHYPEHVVCVEVAGMGRKFGPLPGRIQTWAKNEVCSTADALQL